MAISGNNIFAGTQNGLFFSTDDGNNWTRITVGGGYYDISDIAINGSNIFMATGGGPVFKLVQNGGTWNTVYFGMPKNGQKIQSLAINGTHICAILIFQEAYVSPISAPNWSIIANSSSKTPLSAVAAFGNNFYMGTQQGLLTSSDNCKTWTQFNNGFTASQINTITKNGDDFFLGTKDGVFKSQDSGSTWNALNAGLSNHLILSLAFQGTHIFAAGEGVYNSSDNGANWTSVNRGLVGTHILSITSISTNIFAGTNFGLFLSADNGNSWNPANTGLTDRVIRKLVTDGTNIFAGTNAGLFISTNNGNSWKLLNSGIPTTAINSLAVKGTNVFVGLSNVGMSLSTNSGTSFTPVPYFNSKYINAILIIGTTIYAGESTAHSYKSKDNGITWTKLDSGLINGISCLAAIDTTVFAGSYNLIYKTSPNARCWQTQLSGVPQPSSISDLVVSDTTILAAINPGGVSFSTLNMDKWIKAGNGLENNEVSTLHKNGTNIFAGTSGSGVWMLPLSEISQAIPISKVRKVNGNALSIYPNPGKGKFTITGLSNINSVIVYDMQGKVVFRNADFNNSLSNTIDLSVLNKGIYFITISQEGKIFNEKIVIE